MGISITTNLPSQTAQRVLAQKSEGVTKAAGKLASGSRINSAADDAAGLAISERFKSQIVSTQMAGRNANDAVSIISVAEGGLQEIGNVVVRMRELAMQAASDVIEDSDRHNIDQEFQAVKQEIERIAQATAWDGESLLNGEADDFTFQVGTYNGADADRISFRANENVATLSSLDIDDLRITSSINARDAMARIDRAQTKVSAQKSRMGAIQNRLRSSIDNLAVAAVNRSASNSQIRDTDVALQTTEMTRNQLLAQASASTLAQANTTPEAALRVLG